jgi:hypothetical protein
MELRFTNASLNVLIDIMENCGELFNTTEDIEMFNTIEDELCVFIHMLHKLREEKTLAGLLIRGPLY